MSNSEREMLIELQNMKEITWKGSIIQEKKLPKIKKDMGWEGEGTEANPLIVNSVSGLYPTINFNTGDLHIHIDNITAFKIELNKCKNIKIENSKIYTLELNGCSDNIIRHNSIIELELTYSKKNIVEDNVLARGNIERLKSGYYDNHQKKVDKGLMFVILLQVGVFFLTLMAPLPYKVIIPTINAGLIIGLLLLIRSHMKKEKLTKDLPANDYLDNKILLAPVPLIYEIRSFYKKYKAKSYISKLYYLLALLVPVAIYGSVWIYFLFLV